jgi:hypothetical protein
MDRGVGWVNNYWRNDDGSPTVLLLDRDAPTIQDRPTMVSELQRRRDKEQTEEFKLPDARKFQHLVQDYARTQGRPDVNDDKGRSSDLDSLMFLDGTPSIEIMPPSAIPESYMGLSGLDLIIISSPDLQHMAREENTRFDALKRFVVGGGNLIVFDAGDVFAQAESLLGLTNKWQPADRGKYRYLISSFQEFNYGSGIGTRAPKNIDYSQFPEFQIAKLGFGRVAAVKTDELYAQKASYLQWIFRMIGNERLVWTTRHGISHLQANQDYWDFMIPGFGKAPVKSFLFTICLFIIVIGPVNYFLLHKSKRLYLLPITVGVAASVTTVTMLAYAVVSDGLSTRVRLRSFTHLDQSTGLAATQCRHAYLAAIAPPEGLKYPSTTCVYPLKPTTNTPRRGEFQRDRTSIRQLEFGYIRSRSNTQFLSAQVEETEADLIVEQIEESVTVSNRIGADIEHLWLFDRQGKLRQGERIPTDKTVELLPSKVDDAKKEMNELLLQFRPAPPAGIDKTANNQSFFEAIFNPGRRGGRSPIDFQSGLMEENIAGIKQFLIDAIPGTYVAISFAAPPFVALGTKAKQESGFHVIQGIWERP